MILAGLFALVTLAIFAEMIGNAALMEEHEHFIIPDKELPREIPISRTRFMQ